MTHQPTPEHPPDDGWRAHAACRDSDTRLFTEPGSRDDVRQALAACATCSVRAACLAVALSHDAEADVGIWGGTTEVARRRIRAGSLTVEQALDPDVRRNPEPRKHQVNGTVGNQLPGSSAARPRPVPGPPAPVVTVARDANGDYVSHDGRVIIFQIHGEPPWMLMIDERCVARTRTVTEARRIALTTLHDDHQASMSEPEGRQMVASAQPPQRR